VKKVFLILILLAISSFVSAEGGEVKDCGKYLLYIPTKVDPSIKHPAVVAFSPNADAPAMIEAWKLAAEKLEWYVIASKEFRNNIPPDPIEKDLYNAVHELSETYPIDTSKVIVTGLSGGGMCSYFFAFTFPDMVVAVVSNSGVIHPDYVDRPNYKYPQNKIAVFLTGPEDYNYEQMKLDKKFLLDIGWNNKMGTDTN
jgi:predicted peptidase